jgi:rod shape determining protein RodA
MIMIEKRGIKNFGWFFLIDVILISLLGILTLYITASKSTPGGEALYLRQSLYLILGISIAGGICFINYNIVKTFTPYLYFLTLILLAILTFYYHERWFSLGIFHFQPSELAKLSCILMLANYFQHRTIKTLSGLLIPSLIIGIPFGLIAFQPDLGQALVLIPIFLVIISKAGLKGKYFLFLLITPIFFCLIVFLYLKLLARQFLGFYLILFLFSSLLFLFFLYKLMKRFSFPKGELYGLLLWNGVSGLSFPYLWQILKPYQQTRLLSFLNPTLDPQGSGYNILQAKITIGSGGLLGKGLTGTTQSSLNFLPAQNTDFIFASFAEAGGFLGVVVLLTLYFLLLRSCLKLSYQVPPHEKLVTLGIVSFLTYHIWQNIGMNLGLMPITGITLPWMSYGGSSLIINFAALGLILNINLRKLMF